MCVRVCVCVWTHTRSVCPATQRRWRGAACCNGSESEADKYIEAEHNTHPNWMLILCISAEIWNASHKIPSGFVLSPVSFSISFRLGEMHFVLHWYAFCLLGLCLGTKTQHPEILVRCLCGLQSHTCTLEFNRGPCDKTHSELFVSVSGIHTFNYLFLSV